MRILLVEDDKSTARGIELMLKSEGMVVDSTDMGEDGLEIGKLYDYDLIVLDIMLPDINGMEVLRRLRDARVETPVLILSGLAESEQKVKGLGYGADDYLTKPFNKDELLARIQAIVRRSKGHAHSIIQTGRLSVNLDAHTVEVDGQPVHLTGKEYGILELLSLRKGTTLTKEMFLNHLYGGMDEPELKIIDVFICKLRKKLSVATGGKNYIETVWGRGYVLREPDENEIPQEFDKFWNEEQQKAFKQLVKDENLSKEKTQKLIENYLFAEREPLRDEILELIEGEKPSVLQRKKLGDRILKKILGFVEIFINGITGN